VQVETYTDMSLPRSGRMAPIQQSNKNHSRPCMQPKLLFLTKKTTVTETGNQIRQLPFVPMNVFYINVTALNYLSVISISSESLHRN